MGSDIVYVQGAMTYLALSPMPYRMLCTWEVHATPDRVRGILIGCAYCMRVQPQASTPLVGKHRRGSPP